MSARLTLAGLALSLCACQSVHPLGDDFAELTADGQTLRAAEVMREVFATELGPAGEPRSDREVNEVDAQRIAYRSNDVDATLAWAQVADVDVERFPRAAGHPETVRLLLDPDSPAVSDAVQPFLARAGLKRAYVELALRPPRSGERVRAALACFRRTRPREPEPATSGPTATKPATTDTAQPDATATEPAPSAAKPEWTDTEAQLRQLKQWHAEGLISDEDYDRKRRELLDSLR